VHLFGAAKKAPFPFFSKQKCGSGFLLFFRPGILQTDGSVEDQPAGFTVRIRSEVAFAQKLKMLTF